MTDPGADPPAPFTLDDAMAQAWAINSGLLDGSMMPALLARTRAADFGVMVLTHRATLLEQVEARCIVSRTQRAFLLTVLGD